MTNIWLLPAVVLTVGLVTIDKWLPDPLVDLHAYEAQQIDAEDGAMCLKLVAAADSQACRAEIGALRQRDQTRVSGTPS